MDLLTLLDQVSGAYSKLRSLSAEATIISESGDKDDNQRSERRVRFLYAAPDRMRFEPLGKHGMLQVCDGTRIHTLFRLPMGAPHYSSVPASSHPLPHSFLPDTPSGGGNEPILFARVNERVKEAESLPDENGYRVMSVTYEQRPISTISTSPIRFWIDPDSFRIMGTQVDVGHRLPARDEIQWTRHTVIIRQLRVDEPIPDEAFVFMPPPDAVENPGGRGMMRGVSGGGFSQRDPGGRGMEHHGSHEWQGETFVDHSRWRTRGATFTIERRMTFSENDKRVDIVERATSAKGETEARYALELI